MTPCRNPRSVCGRRRDETGEPRHENEDEKRHFGEFNARFEIRDASNHYITIEGFEDY